MRPSHVDCVCINLEGSRSFGTPLTRTITARHHYYSKKAPGPLRVGWPLGPLVRVCTARRRDGETAPAPWLLPGQPATGRHHRADMLLHRLRANRAPAFVATGYSGRVTHMRWVSDPYPGGILNFSPRQNGTTAPRARGIKGTRRHGRVVMGTYPPMGTRSKHARTFRPYGYE